MSLSKTICLLLSTCSTQEDRKLSQHYRKGVDLGVKPPERQEIVLTLLKNVNWVVKLPRKTGNRPDITEKMLTGV